MGNPGWSYADVLPFFKRMKRYEVGGDDRFRGRDGPLRVTNPRFCEPLHAALIAAAGEVGIPHNPDYNGATQDGIAMSQATIASGRRMSNAACYLASARRRPNLRIETGALAEALLLDGMRCSGIRYSVGGAVWQARAGREVVVSAGSVNAPNSWICRASASRTGCVASGSKCARPCPASARACATIMHRGPAGRPACPSTPIMTSAAAPG